LALNIPGNGIPLHVADGVGPGSDADSAGAGVVISPYLNPNYNSNFQNYVNIRLYSYSNHPNINHFLFATDLTVF
jgi:hypothetical protein